MEYSLPKLTVPLPTLGGKQLWADLFVFGGYRIQQNLLNERARLLGPKNARLAAGSVAECRAHFEALREELNLARSSKHLVLLLHGMFRAKEAFRPMERALRARGYEAESLNYPSTLDTIESHADQVERVLASTEEIERVSLVTHSMGGLVARELLSRDAPWRQRMDVNRLVMIATPNQGAQMAENLLPLWAFRRLAGPAAGQLTRDYVSVLPTPDVRFGIIAGARGDERGYNPLLPGDDDMTVSVESTRLDGAEDMLVVNAIHTFIVQNPKVIEATIRYLETGRFAAAR